MSSNPENTQLVVDDKEDKEDSPGSRDTKVTFYTRDDVIGFFYSVLSGACLALSAVFVKLLEGLKSSCFQSSCREATSDFAEELKCIFKKSLELTWI